MNLSNILSYSLRMLNIANKAIPLIKEVNPTIKTVKKKFINKKGARPRPTPMNNVITTNTNPPQSRNIYQNNSLTFFR